MINTFSQEQPLTIPQVVNRDVDVPPRPPQAGEPDRSDRPAAVPVTKTETLRAEIIWSMKCITSHYSYKSCEDINAIFHTMFPDSSVAEKFTCGERKCAYLCTFGIAPYLKLKLSDCIKNQPYYVLLFDESLNKITQNKQMDIHVRYWGETKTVDTRYYGSVFMGHSTAEDMLEKFNGYVNDLDMSNLIQLSMDGPSVNWKFHELIQNEINQDTQKMLIDVGSCGLHITHGAFRDGVKSSNWDIESVLSCAYYLFHDSPARREDYTQVTDSDLFPKKFCKHRWIENVPVGERMLEIWDNLKTYVRKVTEKVLPNPKNKSFDTLQAATKEPLFTAKVALFVTLAKVLDPLLTRFQTDKPMLPFLATETKKILKDLLLRFIKRESVKDLTLFGLLKLDLEDSDLYVVPKNIDIGFKADQYLKEIILNKKVSDRQILEFRMESRAFMKSLVKKLLDKAPVNYSLVRNIQCLDPVHMSEYPDDCKLKMKRVLSTLVACKRVQSNKCDDILIQFTSFLDQVEELEEYVNFNMDQDRLDAFLMKDMDKSVYKDLVKVVKMLLLLSHGQSSVERGFSVNRQVEDDNMKEKSFVAQRMICDYVNSIGGLKNVSINKALLLSAAGARQKYLSYLDEQSRQKKSREILLKRKSTLDELEELKAKKKRVEKAKDSLVKSAEDYAEKAESTGKLELISKSNSMRRTAKQKESEIEKLSDAIELKLSELKNL